MLAAMEGGVMETTQIWQTVTDVGLRVGLQVLGAIIVFIVGRRLIDLSVRLTSRALARQEVDATVLRYLANFISAALNIALIMAILGFFGVETTTFAALIAAAGVAVGMAWSGLLAHFAAGAFIVVLRPFKVGDFVTAGGVTGTVREIGMFATTMVTPDNVVTVIGNNAVFSAMIQNFSANPYRRVDLVIQAPHGVDPLQVQRVLKDRLAKIPNVTGDPAPDVELLGATLSGPQFAVRPYCHNDHYWQVYFDANRAVAAAFADAGFPAPATVIATRAG
jgi:small conductance mechanosensitive channel